MSEAGKTCVAVMVSAANADAPSAHPSARAKTLFSIGFSRCPNGAGHLTILRVTTVFSAFEQTARAHGAKDFLQFPTSNIRLTYRDALEQMLDIARRYRARGYGR